MATAGGRGLLRRALEGAKARFPGAYWRVRNAAALAQWCARRVSPRGAATLGAYGDAFWAERHVGDWPGFASAVRALVPDLRRVVDVGCGDGAALAGFRSMDGGLALTGVEPAPAAVARARSRGLDVLATDLTRAPAEALMEVRRRLAEADVALCLEVAEHLPPWHARPLVALLAAAPVVVFSAARPLQGGVLHVNEQLASYWIARFADLGHGLHPRDDAFRAAVAALDLPPWYRDNVHVFVRRSA
jgi:SAM-dependent methyltransferase